MLGVRGLGDPVLHHIAPIGLAAAVETALVVDLDGDAPSYAGAPTLAELADRGLRRQELVPDRTGVAIIGNGGVTHDEALNLLEVLGRNWPRVVVRIGRQAVPGLVSVPVIPLLPDPLCPALDRPAVFQTLYRGQHPPVAGVVLPPLSRSHASSLIGGVVEARWRWVRAFAKVWELPWR